MTCHDLHHDPMPKKHHDHFGQIIRALYIYISFQYHFILVSWISSWRTNCFRESNSSRFSTLEIHYLSECYFTFHASIMDLQLENQLFQGNQGSTLWRFISVVNDSLYFCILDLQMEKQLFQGNQVALGFLIIRIINITLIIIITDT